MNQASAYFVDNGERVELSYNNANLPYARATTAGIEAETANIDVNVCAWVGGKFESHEKRQATTAVASVAWTCEFTVGALVVEAGLSIWRNG